MQFNALKAKATEYDEFFLELFVAGKRQTIQGTLTPGKWEPQITEERRKAMAEALAGKQHLVIYDRTNQRIFGLQARFVNSIHPLSL